MIKIKVIDLLVKIANKEELPQMVSYEGKKYHIDELEHFYVTDDRKALLEYIFSFLNDFDALMAELEIIEEDKKIKRIQSCGDNLYSEYIGQWLVNKESYTEYDELLMNKINEIIDYINKENKK